MTINGLLTTAFNPYTSGVSQARAAFRSEAASEVTAVGGGCDCGQAECPTCGKQSGAAESDSIDLSPEAQAFLSQEAEAEREPREGELTEEEQQQVDELKARDTEVRQHEQAHLSAAGPYAIGGPTYEYQQGPDGKRYAIGGEVQIDSAPIKGDPSATIQKMQTVRAAALAPAEPSGQDRKVAAQASAEIQKAQAELNAQRLDEAQGGDETEEGEATSAESVDGVDRPSNERDGDRRKPRNPFQQDQPPVGERVDLAA